MLWLPVCPVKIKNSAVLLRISRTTPLSFFCFRFTISCLSNVGKDRPFCIKIHRILRQGFLFSVCAEIGVLRRFPDRAAFFRLCGEPGGFRITNAASGKSFGARFVNYNNNFPKRAGKRLQARGGLVKQAYALASLPVAVLWGERIAKSGVFSVLPFTALCCAA